MRRPGFIARQACRPHGLLGHAIARIMARETRPENLASIELLDPQPSDDVLEIGSGHGRNLPLIAAQTVDGLVAGVDHSKVMIDVARRHNRALVRQGRVVLMQAASDRIPYCGARFDRVLSVHTVYFWPEPSRHLTEMMRLLRPGGRAVVGFRPRGDDTLAGRFPAEVYSFYTAADIEARMRACGFAAVRSERRGAGDKAMCWVIAETARPATPEAADA